MVKTLKRVLGNFSVVVKTKDGRYAVRLPESLITEKGNVVLKKTEFFIEKQQRHPAGIFDYNLTEFNIVRDTRKFLRDNGLLVSSADQIEKEIISVDKMLG